MAAALADGYRSRARAGPGSTLGLYFKLLGTERQRESALQQAQSEARRAESEGKRATAIKDFLIGVFRINDPRIASDKGHGNLTAKELLDIGSERIKRDFAADPPTQIELLGVTASIFDEIGEHQRYSALHDDYAALTRTHYGERSPRYITALLDAAEHEIRYGDATKQRQLLDQADVLLRDAGLDHSALRGRWWVLMDIDNEPTRRNRGVRSTMPGSSWVRRITRSTTDCCTSSPPMPSAIANRRPPRSTRDRKSP